tara:strand:- start:1390 stop:1968 length:579 start_codon:yes stop_codon:yes gene_type:complete
MAGHCARAGKSMYDKPLSDHARKYEEFAASQIIVKRRLTKSSGQIGTSSMTNVSLAQASEIVDRAIAHGREQGYRPLTVAVLDSGGHLVAFKREDQSSLLRYEIATGKAWGALGMGTASRNLAGVADQRPAFMNAIISASGGRLVPVPGGVLIRDSDGSLVGAVGVSGDASDQDEACAVAGIESAGLTADTG